MKAIEDRPDSRWADSPRTAGTMGPYGKTVDGFDYPKKGVCTIVFFVPIVFLKTIHMYLNNCTLTLNCV